jgi:pimeloyl-ACP methyl ester carboxylesterase
MTQISLPINHLSITLDKFGPDSGSTILFLHAGGESRAVWKPIIQRLLDTNWQLLAPDLRGHGQSDFADQYFFDDFVTDARCLIQQLAGSPLIIVGGSIGGLVGLAIAGTSGSPVDGLVLLDVPTNPSLAAAQRESRKVADGVAQQLPTLAHVDPKVVSGALVQDVLSDPNRIRGAAQRVTVPTLLIRGRHSLAVGEGEQSAFVEDIPHGKIETVDAGHLIARDQPELVADLIRSFLIQHW